MEAVCFINSRTISACCQFLLSFFARSFFVLLETDFAAVFARDPGWQQDCRGVEQLPAKIPDVPFNPGQIQIGKIKFMIWNKILAQPLAYTRLCLGLLYTSGQPKRTALSEWAQISKKRPKMLGSLWPFACM